MRHFYYAGLLGLCVLSLQACGGGASGAAVLDWANELIKPKNGDVG